MKSVRTVLAISHHAEMIGGGEHSLLELLGRLPSCWRPLAVVPGPGSLAERLARVSIAYRCVPLPKVAACRVWAPLRSVRLLLSLCRRQRVDLIYANGSRAAIYGALASRMAGVPVVWHCRVAQPDPMMDALLQRLCTRIVANSQATSRRFRRSPADKVAVVHNGIDVDRFQALQPHSAADGRPKTILMVARRSRWKRHDLALAAFERLAAADPEVRLTFLGDADPEDRGWEVHLQRLVRGSRFRARITVHDGVEDVRSFYRSAAVFLLTSENEPFGRVLVEAMASGLPVVATAGGGVAEIVRHGRDGILLDSSDPAAVAAALGRLLGDGALRRSMGSSAATRSRDFDLGVHVKAMTELFEEALTRSGQRRSGHAVACCR